MPLTTALYTGMSGLSVNQTALDVIGNNIANVNTTAFKGARALFQPEFSETYSFGTSPGDVFGGTNPSQKGLGVRVGKIQRNMSSGNIKLTGMSNDVAIDGDGMFIVEDAQRYYTRNGEFMLNDDNYLTTSNGRYVMGYDVDENYNVLTGSLTRIQIPVNKVTVARATSSVVLDGQVGGKNLKDGDKGTLLTSTSLRKADGTAVDTGTFLVELLTFDASNPTDPGEQVFFDGKTMEFEGKRGDRLQGPRTFEITGNTTVAEYLTFLENAFGVNTDPTITPVGGEQAGGFLQANAQVAGVDTWSLAVRGNIGEENALKIDTGSLAYTDNSQVPMIFTRAEDAVGSSTHTSFDVYDSLGNPLTVDLTFVLKETSSSGKVWQFFANSLDDSDTSTVIGCGEITFDTEGQFVSATNTTLQLDRDDNGVITPMAIELDMTQIGGVVKDNSMAVQLSSQDGEAAGTLNGYSFVEDGSIIGSFTNGSTRVLGQLALATFSNYAGLIDAGDNVFKVGPNSGVAVMGVPMSNGSGQIFAQAIETSNVDISREFIDLIVASTGFSAASKVVTTSNDLLNELMAIVR